MTPDAHGSVALLNLHGITTPPDAVFVCHSSLKSEAERLAAHRRTFNNMTVDVIDVNDIYNEFLIKIYSLLIVYICIKDFSWEAYQSHL